MDDDLLPPRHKLTLGGSTKHLKTIYILILNKYPITQNNINKISFTCYMYVVVEETIHLCIATIAAEEIPIAQIECLKAQSPEPIHQVSTTTMLIFQSNAL